MIKNLIVTLLLVIFTLGIARADVVKIVTLVTGTATGVGSKVTPWSSNRTFQAIGATTGGTGASTIAVEVSNNGANWVQADLLSLTLGTTTTSDTYTTDTAWKFVRGNIATINGTGAEVTLYMGAQ